MARPPSFPIRGAFPSADAVMSSLSSPDVHDDAQSALFDMGAHKAAGPDGFHAHFFQAQWKLGGTVEIVQNVFRGKKRYISRVNETSLTLIQKAQRPVHVAQSRQIGLCNVTCKIDNQNIGKEDEVAPSFHY